MTEDRQTLNRYARIAGAIYLVTILTNLAKLALVDPILVVPGDRGATLAAIAAHPGLYRAGIAYDAAMFVLVVLLAVALFAVLREVNRTLALLALGWRLVEAAVGTVTALFGLSVLAALDGANGDALARLMLGARAMGISFVMIALSLGTLVYCYLFWVSRLVPRWLAGAGLVGFALMAATAFVQLAAPEAAAPMFLVAGPLTILFELAIGGWLLVRGVAWGPSRA